MTYRAKSKNDPLGENGGLLFTTKIAATRHAESMNSLRMTYPSPPWDITHWKEQPDEWVVSEVNNA